MIMKIQEFQHKLMLHQLKLKKKKLTEIGHLGMFFAMFLIFFILDNRRWFLFVTPHWCQSSSSDVPALLCVQISINKILIKQKV